MIDATYQFCQMRKVRTYLKKYKFYSNITREYIYSIFIENTRRYLDKIISRKFYLNLIKELYYRGNINQVWTTENDLLKKQLKIALRIENTKAIKKIINIHFYLTKIIRKQSKNNSSEPTKITSYCDFPLFIRYSIMSK